MSKLSLLLLTLIALLSAKQSNAEDHSKTCDEPVIMLVFGKVSDREKFKAYVDALGSSRIYPKTQGYYRALTPAIDVFEGNPGEARGVAIVRFPCHAAAREFWDSDEYTEIRKLREGVAEFEVLLFKEQAVPDYVKWLEKIE